MRIISGDFGGRKIEPPGHMPHTRPTTDIAKSGLFNILQHNVELSGAVTLDLFGGTGAISYELASRGAASLTVVEKDPTMADFIRSTAEALGISGLTVLRVDVFQFLAGARNGALGAASGDAAARGGAADVATGGGGYDFIFAGPPYALGNIDDLPGLVTPLLKPEGMFVLEHTPRNSYKNEPLFRQERSYGTTVFSFFINRT
ncbi:RsmD family RNA methyltransferase [Dinghuibacter silviterrae]|uniref:16S rRNA G966 N2-methylase RsmD n=1 Tax=Dinghuibacter silviterrae TaxID=1539049 RepID=A0A4R8DIK4_9BACT|nr:RsmD family RNA methyltransferase [Dinghuibacter silviterrae]TDW97573.1 16S rRNA G966 N2-methylase RsmD [Dinghuibacter silviterrae]